MMPRPAKAGPARWELFPHDADVGERGFGATPAQAFEQAAEALTAVVTQALQTALQDVMFGGSTGADAAKKAQATVDAG